MNQGPQAAARFTLSDKIFISRIRYGVIRPCGPDANVNPLAECKPADDVLLVARRNPDGSIRLSWLTAAAGFTPRKISAGVMRAPPPMPVKPTTIPTPKATRNMLRTK